MARIICGDAVAKKLDMVPLSNDTIKRGIQEISENLLLQTIACVKRSGKFSLQLDETIDIANDVQLPVFVRYLDANDYMKQFLSSSTCQKYESKYSKSGFVFQRTSV